MKRSRQQYTTTAWVAMSVPGREDEHGNEESPTAWFAYNRETGRSIRFESFDEAQRFCDHPDNAL